MSKNKYFALGPNFGALGIVRSAKTFRKFTAGYSTPTCKAFRTERQAVIWLRSVGVTKGSDGVWKEVNKHPQVSGSARKESAASKFSPVLGNDSVIVDIHCNFPKTVIAYTDGSYSENTPYRGYGIVFCNGKKEEMFSIPVHYNADAKSSTMEFAPVLKALRMIRSDNKKHEVTIYTDFECTVKLFEKSGEQLKSSIYGLSDDIRALAKEIASIVSDPKMEVTIKKVKAHTGNKYNEKADSLAFVGALAGFYQKSQDI